MRKIVLLLLIAIVFLNCTDKKSSEGGSNGETRRVHSSYNLKTHNNVYITPHGKRYHHSWCRTIQGHSVSVL